MRMLLAATTAAAISMGGGAFALTQGAIPGGGTAANDVLENAGEFSGATTRNGWYGATLYLIGGAANITATVLGYEAGFSNWFNFDGETFVKGASEGYLDGAPEPGIVAGGGTTLGASTGVWTASGVAAGQLSFSFCTGGGSGVPMGCVANGANPDDEGGAAGAAKNFFVSFENENASGGKIAYLFFDDGGGANDDNHDDLVMKLEITGDGSFGIVPLPAAGFLLLGGLGGLAALGRRKSKAKKA